MRSIITLVIVPGLGPMGPECFRAATSPLYASRASLALPEFDVTMLTFRSGIHTVHVEAPDPTAARGQVQAECDRGECHCPAESCTDDVDNTLLDVKQVALDNVVIPLRGWCRTGHALRRRHATSQRACTWLSRC